MINGRREWIYKKNYWTLSQVRQHLLSYYKLWALPTTQLAADLNVQLSKTDDINTSSLDFGICGTVPNGMKKVRLCFFSPITFPMIKLKLLTSFGFNCGIPFVPLSFDMGAAMTIFHSNQNADVTEMNKFRKLYYRLSIAKDANAVNTFSNTIGWIKIQHNYEASQMIIKSLIKIMVLL